MKIKSIKNIAGIGLISILASCNSDKTTPGYTFMDDMYISPSVETYAADEMFSNGMGTQTPVEGTISRGHMPYEYQNTTEGYDSARTTLLLPEEYKNDETIKEAKDLYVKMCGHCHGAKGDGQGSLAKSEKFLGIPGYSKTRLPDITPGSMYHVIMYGRNMMGSHASQLTEAERWEIVSYIWYDLRGETKNYGEYAPKAESTEQETELEVTENNSI